MLCRLFHPPSFSSDPTILSLFFHFSPFFYSHPFSRLRLTGWGFDKRHLVHSELASMHGIQRVPDFSEPAENDQSSAPSCHTEAVAVVKSAPHNGKNCFSRHLYYEYTVKRACSSAGLDDLTTCLSNASEASNLAPSSLDGC